jgi:hypothetical protein
MTLGIQVLVWDKHIHMAGLNVLMGSKFSPLDNDFQRQYINRETMENLFPLSKTIY